ncbi:MAG: thioesterase family protein [Pseudomonadota bacterium]
MPKTRARRADYAAFRQITTRWRDNDVYGHVNNAVFYEYVDTAVNAWIIAEGLLEIPTGPVVGLVVASGCDFHAPLTFPAEVSAGLRVARIGTSSVTYEVGLFDARADEAAAEAHFTHVYVDRLTRRPVPLPERFRSGLRALERAATPEIGP